MEDRQENGKVRMRERKRQYLERIKNAKGKENYE
jgi:hypothetical protein